MFHCAVQQLLSFLSSLRVYIARSWLSHNINDTTTSMSKDANASKEKLKTPKRSKKKERQVEYLTAVAAALGADETERLRKLGEFLETKEKFAAFHDSFFEKLEAQLAKDVAKATDVSLGKHGIPEEVAMKVNEFHGTRFQLPRVLPAEVMAIPHTVSSGLWREEGERLIAAAIRRSSKQGGRAVTPFVSDAKQRYHAFEFFLQGVTTLPLKLGCAKGTDTSRLWRRPQS